MYWNHRVLKRISGGVEEYIIVEVYYDSEDHHVLGWTANAMEPWGLNVDEVRQTLHWMLDATEKEVLDEAILEAEAEARGPLPEEEYETFDNVQDFIAALDSDERLSFDEVLDSLGLEREDVEGWENEGGAA